MAPSKSTRILTSKELFERLRLWFLHTKRALPWRAQLTPYRVWISEIMLQQTRADVVIPYFNRWMERFPDIASLAKADLDKVIKTWEGLGYYSRARALHQTAQLLVNEHRGELPDNEIDLLKLKGIGPYTAAAIASFAFHKKAAPLDGNALRVLTRFNACDLQIATSKAQRELQRQFLEILPACRPWEVAEGVIELGALICLTKNPKCPECPLRPNCRAHALDQIDRYPVRATRVKQERSVRLALIIEKCEQDRSLFIVCKNLGKGAMQDLWEFPHFELSGKSAEELIQCPNELNWLSLIPRSWQLDRPVIQSWTPIVQHTYTRYCVTLRGLHIRINKCPAFFAREWQVRAVEFEELKALPFSSGHRRLHRSLNIE